MGWLLSLYIATTVFGVGVTFVDLLGGFGARSEDTSDGEASGGADDAVVGDAAVGDAADGLGGDEGSGGDEGTAGEDTDADGADEGGDAEGAGEDTADEGGEQEAETDEGTVGESAVGDAAVGDAERVSVVAHDRRQRGNAVIRILSVARSVVYFSLGFGPVGLFATLRGEGVGVGLAWSIPVGVAVMIGTRLLRKVLRQEIDSQFRGEDFIMERGKVIVSIGRGQIGKVRINVGGTYADRYAKAKNSKEDIPAGASVRVVDVTDEYIYIEREDES